MILLGKTYDIQKLKEYEVRILDKYVSICEENNLDYFIAYGTLLGAVRHKGFIPWDDDIDVLMKPSDYCKFKALMSNNNIDGYFYQSVETDRYYPLNFAKFRMNNTKVVETKLKNEPIHQGIFIDIFPLIPYPNDLYDRKKLLKSYKIIHLLIEADLKDKTKYNCYGFWGKLLSKGFKVIHRSVRNRIAQKIMNNCLNYEGNFDSYQDEDGTIFDKHLFDETSFIEFEKKKFKAPKRYHEYLTSAYGDYMTLPNEEDRRGHSFEFVDFKEI